MSCFKRNYRATGDRNCGSFSSTGRPSELHPPSRRCSLLRSSLHLHVHSEQGPQSPGQRLHVNPCCRTNGKSPLIISFAQVLNKHGIFFSLVLRFWLIWFLKRYLKYGGLPPPATHPIIIILRYFKLQTSNYSSLSYQIIQVFDKKSHYLQRLLVAALTEVRLFRFGSLKMGLPLQMAHPVTVVSRWGKALKAFNCSGPCWLREWKLWNRWQRKC